MENLSTIAAFLCLGACILCCFFEKRLRAAYNGAFGLVSTLFFSSGLIGGIVAILSVVFGDLSMTYILSALICIAIAAVFLLIAMRQVPAGRKKLLPLGLAMTAVGLASWFKLTLRVFAWFMRTFLHFNIPKADSNVHTYANQYTTRSYGGNVYRLWNTTGSSALLMSPSGDIITVYPYGSDGLVSDDNNTIYYPG